MADLKVGDLTVEELKELIKSVITQTALELMGDPDKGLERRAEIGGRLRDSLTALQTGQQTISLQEAAAKLGITTPPCPVEFILEAEADLTTLNKPIGQRILKKLRWLADNLEVIAPEQLADEWAGVFKLRVGDYRVIYTVDRNSEPKTIIVHLIKQARSGGRGGYQDLRTRLQLDELEQVLE
jgi:mRNA interferase RelE/StbE